MTKRNTKADRILNDSAMRLEAARIREQTAQSQLNSAKAIREALEEAHDALVKELTPSPRKKAEKPSASPPALNQTIRDSNAKCGICGNKRAFDDHQPESKNYHEFDSGKPKADKGMCAFIYPDQSACNCAEGNPIHEPAGGYAGYHPFVKPVARAPRKSRQKKEEPGTVQSSEIKTAAALSAGAGD